MNREPNNLSSYSASIKPESDFEHNLKWLMFFRVLFTILLLGSTIILQLNQTPSPLALPLLFLYGLIALILMLSFCYSMVFRRIKKKVPFAYTQISLDTFFVTMIIFVTGGFSSVFSLLYLVVIIYSSMFLFRKGSIIMAAFCSIQYGIMIDLEYYKFFKPFVIDEALAASNHDGSHVLYRIVITMAACFAVAFLSSLLSEQARKTKKELMAMEENVKRVEKMAAMGEMAAGLAHEIKNPLASLTGSIQMLREDIKYDPDHDKLMQIILREANRLSSLVSDFLLFAKPQAGKVEAIELAEALTEAVEFFEKDSKRIKHISINKYFIPDIWIGMDPAHLFQTFWNLLLNAAEAIKDQGVIDIRMCRSKNDTVEIRISDNGCGISKEIINSIFDPFFTTKPRGTGLGLSIVHSILKAYDSQLDVESEINRGTTFIVKFKTIEAPRH
ncbi:MAG: GHKL domain-containing protein [Proteobacteria bacterium]|nr:GHKL domain-containing protein [Desulfobacteraceae bacterium]MBU3980355.1 GHKL domain-containing protein [Pseudomonadota bacterium]MBU4013375.1 GHKL domain-containing protein [Pseudomonadota bacterium]MBU4067010.1 GHKL domain-containing protein [Pseudomonadota bacterium]MBU4100038.1 GHKL domain-containing protein [Pseudomonadota bacterium]